MPTETTLLARERFVILLKTLVIVSSNLRNVGTRVQRQFGLVLMFSWVQNLFDSNRQNLKLV